MEFKDCVHITGYNEKGQAVVEHLYSQYDWYEGLHPLIDNDDERAEKGIALIAGKEYDPDGQLKLEWRMRYGPDGRIVEDWAKRSDGTVSHKVF